MTKDILVKNLGITDKEAAVYLAILELGDSTIQPIALRAGIKRTSIYYFIERLVELGLISQIQIRGRMHYQAKTPEMLISLQQERLEEIQKALPQLMSIFNVSAKKPRMSYFEGSEQMQQILNEEARCKKEALYIWPGKDVIDMVGGAKFMEDIDRRRKEKGVFIKVIRFPDRDAPFKDSHISNREHLREIRYAEPGTAFPIAIGIYDTGKVGFLTSRKEGFGILIESTELAQAMKYLFTLFWQQADPANTLTTLE